MLGRRRTSVVRALAPAMCGLGALAFMAVAGCSSDVTRFNLLGTDFLGWAPPSPSAPPPQGPMGYAPPGRGYPGTSAGAGYGMQEMPLAPLASAQDYRPPGRDYSPASAAPYPPAHSDPLARGPDRAPPAWTDRSPPPWTDKDPLPGSANAAERSRPAPTAQQPGWQGQYVMKSGESLYTIAQRYKVNIEDLKRVNGITDT